MTFAWYFSVRIIYMLMNLASRASQSFEKELYFDRKSCTILTDKAFQFAFQNEDVPCKQKIQKVQNSNLFNIDWQFLGQTWNLIFCKTFFWWFTTFWNPKCNYFLHEYFFFLFSSLKHENREFEKKMHVFDEIMRLTSVLYTLCETCEAATKLRNPQVE